MKIAVWVAILAITFFVVICHEIQQQKKKDEEVHRMLQDAAEVAQSANKAKSTFLFNMSHDIRTPMNAILGYAALAKDHLSEPEKLKEYMDHISVSDERLLSIINNVLELARIENDAARSGGKSDTIRRGFDDCHVMFQTALEEKHLTMTTESISYILTFI